MYYKTAVARDKPSPPFGFPNLGREGEEGAITFGAEREREKGWRETHK